MIFEKEKLESEDRYREIGRSIRMRTDLFPEGSNINFVSQRGSFDKGLEVITYERGVEDLTLSCGTGSTASAVAALRQDSQDLSWMFTTPEASTGYRFWRDPRKPFFPNLRAALLTLRR